MQGKFVLHPVDGRRIPIVCDSELVDMSFGTGAVKVGARAAVASLLAVLRCLKMCHQKDSHAQPAAATWSMLGNQGEHFSGLTAALGSIQCVASCFTGCATCTGWKYHALLPGAWIHIADTTTLAATNRSRPHTTPTISWWASATTWSSSTSLTTTASSTTVVASLPASLASRCARPLMRPVTAGFSMR